MSTATARVPVLTVEGGLQHYLREIRKFPILDVDEEYMLAKRWLEHDDRDAAHKLVTSHLRLVVKIAMGYRGYGLPVAELISEGNLGMMRAVKKFDPERGFRLATYAMWWIRASIQEYILHSWSLVKMGTTAAQKKLFFNLRRIKSRLQLFESGDLQPEHVTSIASELDVPKQDVVNMNRRMAAGDSSLNTPIGLDGGGEWQDWLEDRTANQEVVLAETEELDQRRGMLQQAMTCLNDRERHILHQRRLAEPSQTLEELSKDYGISRERVRQIEAKAFEKLQKAMRETSRQRGGPVPLAA